MERVDCVIAGAGVVGLAVGRALAMAGLETIILEKESLIGSGISSRNSEVIHAGLYYPKDSLKARHCVRGKQMLYQYVDECRIPALRCGKLVVATNLDEDATLALIEQKVRANGMLDLERWPAERAIEMEPNLFCTSALWSPTTGVVDSHALMLALQGDIEDRGGFVALNTPLLGATVTGQGFEIETGGPSPMRLAAKFLINATGLHAPSLARMIAGYPTEAAPRGYFCKGNYYGLQGKSPFSRLIYPVPQPGGLGVHVTIDLGGQCRFGPDVEWIDPPGPDGIDYDVDINRAQSFYQAIRRYWPGLADGSLEPGYAGVRPKITAPGEAAGDFVIQSKLTHGIDGLINLFGIESPGLTSSLAIADDVVIQAGLGN